ncbi:lytic transglycosylase domain-containing protein [Herbiconiux sp. YIM B11900]|uniref:lytic transglycosylase domain-containing protein n=1 Tax=Herbiconiux sp. YIM B11900 TaxID=3404131 RepID=UPI003F87342C
MTARIGFGVMVAGMLALAAWLAVGALSAAAAPSASAEAGYSEAPFSAVVPGGSGAAGGSGASGAFGATGAGSGEGTAGTGAPGSTVPSSAADAATPATPATPATSVTPAVPLGPGTASGASTAGRGTSWNAVTLVSPEWAQSTATATGIPVRALVSYAGAALALQSEQPGCGLGWNTIAALGWVESGHGTHGGSAIGADGVAAPPILGPALDGGAYDAIADSDGGVLDGDATGDRAAGPLQFIPGTWAEWGADGNGDGRADPQQLDDAALAAGRYLCHYGALGDPATWRSAVFAYNHVQSYVDLVADTANGYATAANG